jgi:hypothetical protein
MRAPARRGAARGSGDPSPSLHPVCRPGPRARDPPHNALLSSSGSWIPVTPALAGAGKCRDDAVPDDTRRVGRGRFRRPSQMALRRNGTAVKCAPGRRSRSDRCGRPPARYGILSLWSVRRRLSMKPPHRREWPQCSNTTHARTRCTGTATDRLHRTCRCSVFEPRPMLAIAVCTKSPDATLFTGYQMNFCCPCRRSQLKYSK